SGRAHHRRADRERAHSGRQSRDPPRTDHGARGDDPRIFRPASGGDRARGDAEARALCVAHHLRLRALGASDRRRERRRPAARVHRLSRKARGRGGRARRVRDQHRQDEGLPGARLRRRRADAGLPRRAAAVRLEDPEMKGLAFDVAHLLAGGLVLMSFLLLYQTRLYALLNVFAAQAVVLSMSVAWQAYVQDANHLYVTAVIAFAFKAIIIPIALHRIIAELGIDRDVENVVGVGPTMLAGLALVALSEVVMLRIAGDADVLAREDLAFALSVVLLGMLMMVVRRNAVSMVVGFMSLENGLILAATAAKGMPLVVEISVAFSVLVALVVIGVFLFRISERFETVDSHALDRFQGDRR